MALFTLDEIKQNNLWAGYNHFLPSGARGFRPRFLLPILSTPYGAVFVESTSNGIRRGYTVRYIDERDGRVIKLSAFEEYRSNTGAKGRAKREQARLRTEQSEVYGEQVRYFLANGGFLGDVDMPVSVWEISGSLVGVSVHHGGTVYGKGRAEVLSKYLTVESPESWNVREYPGLVDPSRAPDGFFLGLMVTLPETEG